MTRCRACGRQVRATRIAFVLGHEGLKGGRVCRDCERGGVLLVATRLAPVVKVDARASAREVINPFVKSLSAQLRALRVFGCVNEEDALFRDGRIEALENAIALLKEGRT